MFFKGCQIVVVWRTSQWNLCKISLYRKWILSSERAKCVFSNFNKRTRYLGKLSTACFIAHSLLSLLSKGYSLPRRRFYGSSFFIPPHKGWKTSSPENACVEGYKGYPAMSQKWAKSNLELVPTMGRYLRKAALKTLSTTDSLITQVYSQKCV